jgi:hypothetical protein
MEHAAETVNRSMVRVLAQLDEKPWLAAILVVVLTVGGLALGRAPIGGDPDYMYRPIKSELQRALRSGTLPYWSDRMGLGVPLVAESHAAAFYPPNWLLYGLLSVGAAYRFAMFAHYLALTAVTYAYARCLRIGKWGAALAAVCFTLCGFQAMHSVHEPFYMALPFLPLCLLLADRYATTGRLGWLALLALSWGAQLTLGHFQIPMWTGGLTLITGGWRVLSARKSWVRLFGIAAALGWAAAIAGAQLGLTVEMWRLSGFGRSTEQLEKFALPPSHWIQPVLPTLFMRLEGGSVDPYWTNQNTNEGESSFYVGTLPLIFAGVGWLASDRERRLTPWRWIVVLSWLLASLPGISAAWYAVITQVPGLGWFRAPGRYTAVTSFGLALLAGRGFDKLIPPVVFRRGMLFSVGFGFAAFAWAGVLSQRPDLRAGLGIDGIALRFAISALSWCLCLAAIWAWRRGTLGAWAPFALASIELAILYCIAPSVWEWRVPSPAESPILSRLAREPDIGLVISGLGDMAVRAGIAPAFPYLGMTPPPPAYLLEHADKPKPDDIRLDRWRRRLGVTHSIQTGTRVVAGRDLLISEHDLVLDRLLNQFDSSAPEGRLWSVLTCPGTFPAARLATRAFVTDHGGEDGWKELYIRLNNADCEQESTYILGNEPEPPSVPWARSARVISYDGRTAVVEHDGACDLIVRRAHYAGWTYQVNGGPARPAARVDGGLQGARLSGSGTSRVTFRYEPTGLRWGLWISGCSVVLALGCACTAVARGQLSFSA